MIPTRAGDPRYFDFAAQEDKSLRGLDHLGLLKDPILLGLEKLVISSGGHVRNLLGLMVDLLFQARRLGLPIHEADVDTVAQLWREPMRLAITSEAAMLMTRVSKSGRVDHLDKPSQARAAGRLILNSLLLNDGEMWFIPALAPSGRPTPTHKLALTVRSQP